MSKLKEGIHVISEGKDKREIIEIKKDKNGKFLSATRHERKNYKGEWSYKPQAFKKQIKTQQ